MTTLYTKPLLTVCTNRDQYKEDVYIIYAVSIENSSNIAPSKRYVIRLTKDDDPLFLRICSIDEAYFNELKTRQRLRVTFDEFGEYFVNLLESSSSKAKNLGKRSSPQQSVSDVALDGRFLHLIENVSDVKLEIGESNKNQTCVYLPLKFDYAKDKELQKYLCDTIFKIKIDYQDCRNAREKLTTALKTMKNEYEKEKRCSQNEIEVLSKDKANIEDSFNQISRLHAEAVEEIKNLRLRVADFDEARHHLESQLNACEHELDEKDGKLINLMDKFRTLSDRNIELEEYLQRLKDDLHRKEQAYEFQRSETDKGVEIIRKFQNMLSKRDKELKASVHELNACEDKIKELDQKLKQCEDTNKIKEAELSTMKSELSKLQQENSNLSEKVSTLEKCQSEQKSDLEKKNLMISILNRQLSETRLKPAPIQPVPYDSSNNNGGPKSFNYVPVLGVYRNPLYSQENIKRNF